MIKLGFLINHLGANQKAYFMIRNINSIANTRPDVDATIFYSDVQKPCMTPLTGVMNTSHIYNYDGVTIATCLHTANKLQNLIVHNKKFFYVFDLEWIDAGPFRYADVRKAFCSPNMHLIARSEDHKKVIENVFNTNVYAIIDNFNIDDILQVVTDGPK